jgi:lysophospholipase L1-like esterase
VFYDGENDLAGGEPVDNVVADYTNFVAAVHAQLPHTPVLFISLKPSPVRWKRWKNEIIEVNHRIALIKGPQLEYVDVFSHMVDANGDPRADLFLPDRLHPNEKCYTLWASLIRPYLNLSSHRPSNN